MRRFAFLAAATRISAFEFHPEVAYQLRGEHLVITAVAEHYAMEMFSSFATNKTLLPVENWRGLLRDVIDWIARKAGFTFELRSASGDGRSCYRDAGGGKGPPEIYATDYICAQEDVFDFHGTHVDYLDFHEVPTIHGARKNRSMDGHTMTDVYLGIFYITPFRLALSLMTVPIISDVGLTIVLRKEELSGWDQAAFIFDPFTKSGRTLLGTPPAHLSPWPTPPPAGALCCWGGRDPPPQQQRSAAGGVGTPPPSSSALLLGGAGISVQTAAVSSMRSSCENLWSASKSVPRRGLLLPTGLCGAVQGEPHGLHHVAARHCGDASRRT